MTELTDQINYFPRYFRECADRHYVRDPDGGFHYRGEHFKSPVWMPCDIALQERISRARDDETAALYLANYYLKLDSSPIEAWLRSYGIDALSLYAQGKTAIAFQARRPDAGAGERLIFRLGVAKDTIDFTWQDCKRAWCPLTLQPYVEGALALGGKKGAALSFELMPMLSHDVSEGMRSGYYVGLLDQYVLAGTAYEVIMDKDLAVAADGTPLNLDPGSLGFRTKEIQDEYTKLEPKTAWQQTQMEIIYANCQKIGLPEPMNWVIKGKNGRFIAKQSLLFKNPFRANNCG